MIIPVRIQSIFITPESSLCPLLVSLVLFPVQVSGGPSHVLPESWTDLIFLDCMRACEVTLVVSDSVTLMDPYVAHQVPLSMGFFRQEYWSGLSCPPPGVFVD